MTSSNFSGMRTGATSWTDFIASGARGCEGHQGKRPAELRRSHPALPCGLRRGRLSPFYRGEPLTQRETPYARPSKNRFLVNSTDEKPDVMRNTLPSRNDAPVRQASRNFAPRPLRISVIFNTSSASHENQSIALRIAKSGVSINIKSYQFIVSMIGLSPLLAQVLYID
jgi:hypothetical protein